MAENINRIIAEKEKKRHQFLFALYELAEERGNFIPRLEIVKRSGLDTIEADRAEEYLEGEGSLKLLTMGPNGMIELTHQGRIKVEQSLKSIEGTAAPSQHNTYNYNYNYGSIGTIGTMQNGNHNTVNIEQNYNPDISEILNLLQGAREHIKELTPNDQQEAARLTDIIEEEVQLDNPNWIRVRSYASALLPFMEKITAAVVAEGIKRLVFNP